MVELQLVGDRPIVEAAVLNFGSTGPNDLVIDATGLTFASPMDLAGIVATARWAADEGMSVAFKMPAADTAAAYLQRMNLLLHMPAPVQIFGRVPPDGRTDQRNRLLEVTPVDAKNTIELGERLGRLIKDFYTEHQAPGGAAVVAACGELLSNFVDHGESAAGGFISAQTYSGATTEGPRVEFAICDLGEGVRASLKRNPKYSYLTRDEAAIVKALNREVSGTTEDGRGNGLFDVIEKTRVHGKLAFHMRSGSGQVSVLGNPSQLQKRPGDRPDHTTGTWASLTHWIPAQR